MSDRAVDTHFAADVIAFVVDRVLEAHRVAGTDLESALQGMATNFASRETSAMRVAAKAVAFAQERRARGQAGGGGRTVSDPSSQMATAHVNLQLELASVQTALRSQPGQSSKAQVVQAVKSVAALRDACDEWLACVDAWTKDALKRARKDGGA